MTSKTEQTGWADTRPAPDQGSPESGAVKTEVTADDPEHRSQLAMALSMSLPGARLDMVLGGPQPLLMELVRALAHEAARADHEADCEPSMLVGQISG